MEWKKCPWVVISKHENNCLINQTGYTECLYDKCPQVMWGEKVKSLEELATLVNTQIDVSIARSIEQLNQRLDNQQIDMDILRRRIANEDKDTDGN